MSQMYSHVDIAHASTLVLKPIKSKYAVVEKILLDTNVIISLLQDPTYCHNYLSSLNQQKPGFVTIDKMWHEVTKVTGIKHHVAENHIQKIFGNIQTIRTTNPLEEYAYSVQCKTNCKCHWPDSILIVLGVWFGWKISSHDTDLLSSCKLFGVKHLRPNSSGKIEIK